MRAAALLACVLALGCDSPGAATAPPDSDLAQPGDASPVTVDLAQAVDAGAADLAQLPGDMTTTAAPDLADQPDLTPQACSTVGGRCCNNPTDPGYDPNKPRFCNGGLQCEQSTGGVSPQYECAPANCGALNQPCCAIPGFQVCEYPLRCQPNPSTGGTTSYCAP